VVICWIPLLYPWSSILWKQEIWRSCLEEFLLAWCEYEVSRKLLIFVWDCDRKQKTDRQTDKHTTEPNTQHSIHKERKQVRHQILNISGLFAVGPNNKFCSSSNSSSTSTTTTTTTSSSRSNGSERNFKKVVLNYYEFKDIFPSDTIQTSSPKHDYSDHHSSALLSTAILKINLLSSPKLVS